MKWFRNINFFEKWNFIVINWIYGDFWFGGLLERQRIFVGNMVYLFIKDVFVILGIKMDMELEK